MNHHIILTKLDCATFAAYLIALSVIGWWAGRKQADTSSGYFLASRSLPWYVVGSSFIAANISTEHFIGMVGAAVIYGICVATPEWSSVIAFTFLIWIFIPFLMSARVFTAPEFLERRFSPTLRLFFATVTVIVNIFGFLAPVLYGGGLALDRVMGFGDIWSTATDGTILQGYLNGGLYSAITIIAIVAGFWAILGGLRSVAWMDVLTIVVKLGGGLLVTWFGLKLLSGPADSVWTGFKVMIERNQASTGVWRDAVEHVRPYILPGAASYNRLSVIQPLTHETTPWSHWVLSFFYIGLWYTVINQFMIQRVLAARSLYDARMGIVFAGFLKLLLPFVVVVPGLIFFALHPDILLSGALSDIRPEADRTYINMIRDLIPVGLKGVLLAALFGAIQSTVSAVINSTSTIVTLDIYKRFVRSDLTEHESVKLGRWVAGVTLIVSIVSAFYISSMKASLFVYIQELYTFFAPPFSAIFLLGTLWRRVNGTSATSTIFAGFVFGIAVKILVSTGHAPLWLAPYANQGIVNWAICMVLGVVLSLLTQPPRPEQITDDLTMNWKNLNLGGGLGARWYQSVPLWWAATFAGMTAFIIIFGAIL
ncbi:MAG TPA: sodium/solute symporter [Opitutaceae bacterium]